MSKVPKSRFFGVWCSETPLILPPCMGTKKKSGRINGISDKKMTAFSMTSPTNYLQRPQSPTNGPGLPDGWSMNPLDPSRAAIASKQVSICSFLPYIESGLYCAELVQLRSKLENIRYFYPLFESMHNYYKFCNLISMWKHLNCNFRVR